MKTVFETVQFIKRYRMGALSVKERHFIKEIADGLDGLGNPSDEIVDEYISPEQVAFIRTISKRIGR